MTCRTAWAGEQLHDIEAETPWRQRVTRSARFRGGITRVQSESVRFFPRQRNVQPPRHNLHV